jgi:hypothetical protein
LATNLGLGCCFEGGVPMVGLRGLVGADRDGERDFLRLPGLDPEAGLQGVGRRRRGREWERGAAVRGRGRGRLGRGTGAVVWG